MIHQIEPNLGAFGVHSGYSRSAACLGSVCREGVLSQGDIEAVFSCLAQTGTDEVLIPSGASVSSMLSPH